MARVYVLVALFAFLVAACDRAAPKLDDVVLRRIRTAYPGMTEACLDRIKYGGIEAMPMHVEKCFRMTSPQRWRGLWRDDFEGQHFCSSRVQVCSYEKEGERIWITFKSGTRPTKRSATGRVFTIDFVGRRTLLPGHHGHMGVSQHEIVVEKLISFSPIPVVASKD